MPHDERMLKTAYKPLGKGHGLAGSMHRRGGNSQTPFQNKNYEMKGMASGQLSPDLDRHADMERKYERAKQRWEQVLDKKHANMDEKNKKQKEQLFKKFKREKEMAKKNNEDKELKQYE